MKKFWTAIFAGLLLGQTAFAVDFPFLGRLKACVTQVLGAFSQKVPAEIHPSATHTQRVSPRAQALETLFSNVASTHGHTDQGIVALLRDRSFLPEGGTLVVVGPGPAPNEFLVPLILRPDVQVRVVENSSHRMAFGPTLELLRGQRLDYWDLLARRHPDLVSASPHVHSRETLKAAIEHQLRHVNGLAEAHQTQLKGDLVMVFSPFEYFIDSEVLRPDGIMWVVQPAYGPWGFEARTGDETIELSGELSKFLPWKLGGQGDGSGFLVIRKKE